MYRTVLNAEARYPHSNSPIHLQPRTLEIRKNFALCNSSEATCTSYPMYPRTHRKRHYADPFPQTSDANAGGYCHRTALTTGNSVRTVWFSDELTPRADWTWNNFFLSASIRFYCWQHCACTFAPTRENTTSTPSTTKLWAFVKNHELSHNTDGSYTYQKTGSHASEGQVLPPQNRLGTPAGSCGADGKQFCSVGWPTGILGPIPQSPPYSTEIKHIPSSNNMTVCGNTCNGPQDCGSRNPEVDCFCALPSPDDAHRLGLDPVASSFVCLELALSVSIGGLGGRDVKRYVDEKGWEYRCPCNETFVAPECCGVGYGRVDLS